MEGQAEDNYRQPRTLLVSYLGSVVRRFGGWMPIGGTIALLKELGVDEASARTAVFRLKKKGWLVPERRDGIAGYLLTDLAHSTLDDGDRVIWNSRTPATLDDGWCLITFSVPEKQRSRRHLLRSHLSSLGFGNTSGGVWIAPARMEQSAQRVLDELELNSFASVFVGRYSSGVEELRKMVRDSWELGDLDGKYRSFTELHSDCARRIGERDDPVTAAEAFRLYLGTVDDWRKLPFQDPGLPRELLDDDWPADEARSVFQTIVGNTEGQAIAYAGRRWP